MDNAQDTAAPKNKRPQQCSFSKSRGTTVVGERWDSRRRGIPERTLEGDREAPVRKAPRKTPRKTTERRETKHSERSRKTSKIVPERFDPKIILRNSAKYTKNQGGAILCGGHPRSGQNTVFRTYELRYMQVTLSWCTGGSKISAVTAGTPRRTSLRVGVKSVLGGCIP